MEECRNVLFQQTINYEALKIHANCNTPHQFVRL